MKHRGIIAGMTLEEKVAFCSGADYWNTKAFKAHGIPSVTMCDGPHGLRRQRNTGDHLGLNESVPATCFPTACATGCSWDRALLREIGEAIAEEALREGVSLVLGPGVNIKRNPLCGRNFEYFSEDPYLSGELARGWIDGAQGRGVGACVKHFAANNQESRRMTSDSVMDERTLREIYLPAFERAVKSGGAATVMTAYNKLNGVYCSQNAHLLGKILREEWGFDGVVMTDWVSMSDRVKSFHAGLDLEMPGGASFFDCDAIDAVRSGALPEERIDECVDRLLSMVDWLNAGKQQDVPCDMERHHALAARAAEESAVLLKNDGGILPLERSGNIALIGAMARQPRYQGAGSSHINPSKLVSAMAGMSEAGFRFRFAEGYSALRDEPDHRLESEAVELAAQSDVAVVFAGLPESYESEGFDRAGMGLPPCQNQLIEAVAAANPDTVVVLSGGAPVELPWIDRVRAVLLLYLPGQAGGMAAARLLAGDANPSGKLAETWPIEYADVPSAGFYEVGGNQAQYREGVYVGYRYYEKADVPVQFPFGHGLSYSGFAYADLRVSKDSPYGVIVSLTVRNTGGREGAEVVQLYVGSSRADAYRPVKELKGFEKVFLKAGEAKTVEFKLDRRSFSCYDSTRGDWIVTGGQYRILVGSSSADIRLQGTVSIDGDGAEPAAPTPWYSAPAGRPSQHDFEALLGRKVEAPRVARKGEFTLDNTLEEMKGSFVIRMMISSTEKMIGKRFGGVDYANPTFRTIMETVRHSPIRSLALSGGGISANAARGLVHLANGRLLRGIREFVAGLSGAEHRGEVEALRKAGLQSDPSGHLLGWG